MRSKRTLACSIIAVAIIVGSIASSDGTLRATKINSNFEVVATANAAVSIRTDDTSSKEVSNSEVSEVKHENETSSKEERWVPNNKYQMFIAKHSRDWSTVEGEFNKRSKEKTAERTNEGNDKIMLLSNSEEIVYEKPVLFYSEAEQRDVPIDVDRLYVIYNTAERIGDWDFLESYREINVLYDFLVRQMGVSENIAYGIIGNTSNEGNFGMQQGTYYYFKDCDDAVEMLNANSKSIGYGIAQWTTKSRRVGLAEYYVRAAECCSNFKKAQILAECMYLYDELHEYKLFDSFTEDVSIEHACGKIAREFEGYDGSATQWKKDSNGEYKLVKSKGSGAKRLEHSYKIKEMFSGQ